MQKKTKTVWVVNGGDGNGKEFNSEAEAMAFEIDSLASNEGWNGEWIVANKDAILTILGARRKPRSDKGQKRKTLKLPKTETAA